MHIKAVYTCKAALLRPSYLDTYIVYEQFLLYSFQNKRSFFYYFDQWFIELLKYSHFQLDDNIYNIGSLYRYPYLFIQSLFQIKK